MPSKQASISSFFKPKTSNVTVKSTSKNAEKPKVKSPPPKKPDNKENVGKMIKNLDLKSDSDSDEDVIKPRKNRRAKVIDSSDSEEEAVKPAKKKQKLEPKKEPAASQSSESEEEEDDDFDEENSEGGNSSGSEMGSDLDDELAALREEQTEEERAYIEQKQKEPKSKKEKAKKAKVAEKKKPKKKGFRAETDEDNCPFSEVDSQSPQKPKTPKKSPKAKAEPKTKVEPSSPMQSPLKKSPKASPAKKQMTPAKPGEYDPTLAKYHPVADACWKIGEPVPYHALARTLECCEENSGRLAKTEYLANFFRSVIELNPGEIVSAIHMPLNLLAAAYEGVELGIGDMVLIKAISQATGRPNNKIKADMQEAGDLGIVAQNSKGSQKMMFQPKPLKMGQVYSKLQKIASVSGNSSQNTKVDLVKGLLVACKGSEARYLIRSCSGKLRIGVSEQTVLSAIARAMHFHSMEGKEKFDKEKMGKIESKIKEAFSELPNYEILMKALLEHGWKELGEHVQLQPGVPLKPMLAHPTKAITEILSRFGTGVEFTAEYKYDGERAQIHILADGSMRVFSRNQEDNTSKYPDIIRRMPNALNNVQSAVIDTESVAWDTELKTILPFQILTTRKRKDVDEKDIKVQVCVHAFDLLYLNGKSLVREPLKERRRLMHQHFNVVEGEFVFATAKDMSDIEDLQVFLDESVKDGTEGLMVKALCDSYEISKRSHSWLKLKKDYLGTGVGDSIDVVIIGADYGKGKRSGNYGGFLAAIYDTDGEEYQTVCKLGTGLKDDDLKKFTEMLSKIVCDKKSYYRVEDKKTTPDVFFEPQVVWEIKCADLSISPVHTAAMGLVDPAKGISLRFPRYIRHREDKNPDQATSADQIVEMYNAQDVIVNSAGARAGPK